MDITKNKRAYRLFLQWEHLRNNESSREQFSERYRGVYGSKEKFAQEYYESTYDMDELPKWAQGHLDYESLAIDLFNGDYYDLEHEKCGIHVFSEN